MKKYIKLILVMTYISIPSFLFAAATSGGTGTPTKATVKTNTGSVDDVTSRLRIRVQPNINSTIIGFLYAGDEVSVLGVSGKWFQVSNGSVTGWSSSDHLIVTEYDNGDGDGNDDGTSTSNGEDGVGGETTSDGVRDLYATASHSKVPPLKDSWFTKFVKKIKRTLGVLKDTEDDSEDGDKDNPISNEVTEEKIKLATLIENSKNGITKTVNEKFNNNSSSSSQERKTADKVNAIDNKNQTEVDTDNSNNEPTQVNGSNKDGSGQQHQEEHQKINEELDSGKDSSTDTDSDSETPRYDQNGFPLNDNNDHGGGGGDFSNENSEDVADAVEEAVSSEIGEYNSDPSSKWGI